MLLLILQVQLCGCVDRPPFCKPGRADAEPLPSAHVIADRYDQQMYLARMGFLTGRQRVEPGQCPSTAADQFTHAERDLRLILQTLEDVMSVVPLAQVVPETFGVRFIEERNEIRRATSRHDLEQPAARRAEVVDLS